MDPFLGEIRPFAFGIVPQGWAQCDGRILSIAQNQALFALIGNYYGGDGRTNFALPDLRGRAPMDVGVDAAGYRVDVAANGGSESVMLTAAQMPVHTHSVQGNSVAGLSGTPANNYWAVAKNNVNAYGSTGDINMAAGALSTVGGQAHENRQPFLALNFCIATQGIFPPRS